MASISEKTFGNRYQKGRDLQSIISGAEGYTPDNPEIVPLTFGEFLDGINSKNSDVATTNQSLSDARDARYALYYGSEGLKQRVFKIRDYLASTKEGKKTAAYKNVVKEAAKFQGNIRNKKKPIVNPPEGEDQKQVSQSERSFGSLLQSGKNVLAVIKKITGYAPSNEALTVTNFEAFIAEVEAANKAVIDAYTDATTAVSDRLNLYEGENGLRERIQKVKKYVASAYNKNDSIWALVSAIKY